jgi:hypothetical protein
MRGLPKAAIENIENLATALLESAVKKNGRNIPTSDPDWCQAFGVLRGAIASQGPRITGKIRIAPGDGDPTHESVHAWCRELTNRVTKDLPAIPRQIIVKSTESLPPGKWVLNPTPAPKKLSYRKSRNRNA